MRPNHTRRRRWVRASLVAGATTAMVVSMIASPANAASRGPDTAVSSDGTISTAVNAAATSHSVPSYQGTGELAGSGTSASDGEPFASEGEGEIGTESVIGADNRWRISPTTGFPARAIAMITLNGRHLCTGWLIGRNTLATAGHCVHTGGGGSWRSGRWRIYPGRNGSRTPYGSCGIRSLHSVLGWTRDGNEGYDYGAIKLNCSIGRTTGWFGFWWQSTSLTGQRAIVSGYPADKRFGTHWRDRDTVRVTGTRQVFYRADTFGGQSGSPVFRKRSGCGWCSMGIHAYGLHGAAPHGTNNHGTRIREGVFNNLRRWRNL